MAADQPTPRPSALKHGLTSRWVADGLAEEVRQLANLLVGSSSPEPAILNAAHSAAEAILHLRRVRSMKVYVLNEADPSCVKPEQAEQAAERFSRVFAQLFGRRSRIQNVKRVERAGTPPDLAILSLFESSASLLHRIDEYERRALSRRSKAIRALDVARIDAERHRVA